MAALLQSAAVSYAAAAVLTKSARRAGHGRRPFRWYRRPTRRRAPLCWRRRAQLVNKTSPSKISVRSADRGVRRESFCPHVIDTIVVPAGAVYYDIDAVDVVVRRRMYAIVATGKKRRYVVA